MPVKVARPTPDDSRMVDPRHPIQEVRRHLSAAVLALADCHRVDVWPANVAELFAAARLLTESQERSSAAAFATRVRPARRRPA